MTRLVRKAALLGACGLFIASVAGAAVPDPAHSTVPAFIIVGGVQGTANFNADRGILTSIVVRDFLNNPIVGSNVELNYSLCADTRLCRAVVAGNTVDSPSKTVRGQTGVGGVFAVSLLGASFTGFTGIPYVHTASDLGCLKVYADGIQLGTATSVVLDLNGSNAATQGQTCSPIPGNMGVTGADLSECFRDIGDVGLGQAYRGRSDFSSVPISCANGAACVPGLVPASDIGQLHGPDAAYLITRIGESGLGLGSGGGCRGNGPSPCPTGFQSYTP